MIPGVSFEPYSDAKAILLANIAEANGCSAVWSKRLGCATVFGFGPELDAVDTLFASLLVQAGSALRRHGMKIDSCGRRRTKSYRNCGPVPGDDAELMSGTYRLHQTLAAALLVAADAAAA